VPLWLALGVLILWTLHTRADPPAAGTLDNTFGNGGIVITSINGRNDVTSMALQSDGKIVAAGKSYNGSNDDFAVVRYNTDGSLDTSSNGSGKVVTAIGLNNDKAYGVAVQDNGKIVVAGIWINSAVRAKIAVVRYNADDALDTSFNGTGIVTTDISAYNDFANGLVIQPDGKIVIGGFGQDPGADAFELVRYNSDGSLDVSLNSTGIVKTEVGGHRRISGNPSFDSNTMTVNLTDVTNVQTMTVTLSGVTDTFNQLLPDTPVSMNVLIGDTTGDKTMNSADVSQTKAKSGQAVGRNELQARCNRGWFDKQCRWLIGEIEIRNRIAVTSGSGCF
jgi:uncharacterized delta-60 repeat protein